VRYKNWKFYYKMSKPGPGGWLESLEDWNFPLVQNIKRDPFEQNVTPFDTKSFNWFGGALAAPSSAYVYDAIGMLPMGQVLWLQELETYVTFPPMQSPSSYNLTQVIAEIRESKNQRHIAAPAD